MTQRPPIHALPSFATRVANLTAKQFDRVTAMVETFHDHQDDLIARSKAQLLNEFAPMGSRVFRFDAGQDVWLYFTITETIEGSEQLTLIDVLSNETFVPDTELDAALARRFYEVRQAFEGAPATATLPAVDAIRQMTGHARVGEAEFLTEILRALAAIDASDHERIYVQSLLISEGLIEPDDATVGAPGSTPVAW